MTKQESIYRDLRKRILEGYYQPWSNLDNEVVLCKRYEVSRPTLQKAISRLKQDGLVHSRQGSGIFVNPPEFFSQRNMLSLSEQLSTKGSRLESKVLLFEEIPCGDMSDLFHLQPQDPLVHYRRLRLVDGTPKLVDNAYMPRYLFRDLDESVLHGSMLSYMEESCGYAVSHGMRTIKPIAADEELAGILSVEPGKLLLETDQVIYAIRSIVLQYLEEIGTESEMHVMAVR